MVDFGEAMLDAVRTAAHLDMWVTKRAVGPSAWRGGRRNWMPVSVSTVWDGCYQGIEEG